MSERDTSRFEHDFVAFRNLLVAVPYTGPGTSLVSVMGIKAEDMTRLDKFRHGQPIYLFDNGDVTSMAFRRKAPPVKNPLGRIQDVIVGFKTTSGGVIQTMDILNPDTTLNIAKPLLDSPQLIDIEPTEILPIYMNPQTEDRQDVFGPRGLLVIGFDGIRIMDGQYTTGVSAINPPANKWKRGFNPSYLEISPKKERISVISHSNGRFDLTASLHRRGVDLTKTFERNDEYGTWKLEDGAF